MLIHRVGLEIHNVAADPETDSKYAIASVHITPDGSVTACDGKQWLRMCAAAAEPDLFAEQLAGETPGEVLDAPVLIPADVVKAFLAASKRKAKPGQRSQQLVVAVHGGAVTLATADGKTKRTFIIDDHEGSTLYPAFERTIPRGQPTATVTLDIEAMLTLLTTLKRCGASCCEVSIHETNAPIRVTARVDVDDSESIIDGVFMPRQTIGEADEREEREAPATPTGPMFDASPVVEAVLDEVAKAASGDGPVSRAAAEFVERSREMAKKHGGSVTLSVRGQSVAIDADGAHAS